MITATFPTTNSSFGFLSSCLEALRPTEGVSTQANSVKKSADLAYKEIFDSSSFIRSKQKAISMRDNVSNELLTVYFNCRKDNWDGYGAAKILPETVENCTKFIASFENSQFEGCELSPETDGEMAFEWYGEEGSILSISVGSSGSLAFAGRFSDTNKVNGVQVLEQLDRKFFQTLIQMV
jgi:hypothetical protein